MHAAGHQEVARTFGRRLGEDRRLDVEEALLVEVLPHRHRDAVPQDDVLLQGRAAQVEVAVLEPRLFRHRLLAVDEERRRLRFVEQADGGGPHLDLAGGQLGVHRVGRAAFHQAFDADDELAAQPLGLLDQCGVVLHDHLRDAVAVAHVEEHDRAEVAHLLHPAEQHRALVDVGGPQRAAGVRTSERSELLSHESAPSW